MTMDLKLTTQINFIVDSINQSDDQKRLMRSGNSILHIKFSAKTPRNCKLSKR